MAFATRCSQQRKRFQLKEMEPNLVSSSNLNMNCPVFEVPQKMRGASSLLGRLIYGELTSAFVHWWEFGHSLGIMSRSHLLRVDSGK